MALVLPIGALTDHRVLPRDANGEVRIELPRRANPEVAGDGDWRVEGRVLVLKTGGPYAITAKADGGGIHLTDILVGDVWALAGQSNMAGAGALDPQPQPIPGVRMLGFDERWQPAVDPLHRLWENPQSPVLKCARRDCHAPMSDAEWAASCAPYFAQQAQAPVGGVGPGSMFARHLAERTGVPIGLVPCALGATSLYTWRRDWASKVGAPPADTLYGNLIDRARRAGPLAGIVWYQGEGDSGPQPSADYFERFRDFVAEVRQDLNQPALRFVTAQLCKYDVVQLRDVLGELVDPATVGGWPAVREAQRRAADEIAGVDVVATADLSLVDGVHLDRPSADEVGRRMAALVADGRRSPRLVEATSTGTNRPTIACRFADVDGGLVVEGPCDFAVTGAQVLDVSVDGDVLVLTLDRSVGPGATLTYGPGLTPRVGLFDKGGLPVPLFGPVPVQQR
jgi:sialate O-acetylesterase